MSGAKPDHLTDAEWALLDSFVSRMDSFGFIGKTIMVKDGAAAEGLLGHKLIFRFYSEGHEHARYNVTDEGREVLRKAGRQVAERRPGSFVEVKVPELGFDVETGEILTGEILWHVKDGCVVDKDKPLFDIITGVLELEIPSPFRGKVRILEEVGSIVKARQVVCRIDRDFQEAPVPSRFNREDPI